MKKRPDRVSVRPLAECFVLCLQSRESLKVGSL